MSHTFVSSRKRRYRRGLRGSVSNDVKICAHWLHKFLFVLDNHLHYDYPAYATKDLFANRICPASANSQSARRLLFQPS